MPKLACISVDLDGLPHYCRVHGLDERDLPPAGATAVSRRSVERFAELFDRKHVAGTFFAIGEDLEDEASAAALADASRMGHELGNHTYRHDYALSRRSAKEVAEEIADGAGAIEAATGIEPVGFRAPGYALSPAILEALEVQGYLYDASVLPSPPYYAAKAAARAAMGLAGRTSASVQDRIGVLGAPRVPYRPDVRNPYARGTSKLVELPVATVPVSRIPFIGTTLVTLPKVGVASLYRAMRFRNFLNLELHGIDVLDESDGASLRLARLQRDLRIPAGAKEQRLAEVIDWIRNDFEVVTLEEAARRLAPELR